MTVRVATIKLRRKSDTATHPEAALFVHSQIQTLGACTHTATINKQTQTAHTKTRAQEQANQKERGSAAVVWVDSRCTPRCRAVCAVLRSTLQTHSRWESSPTRTQNEPEHTQQQNETQWRRWRRVTLSGQRMMVSSHTTPRSLSLHSKNLACADIATTAQKHNRRAMNDENSKHYGANQQRTACSGPRRK